MATVKAFKERLTFSIQPGQFDSFGTNGWGVVSEDSRFTGLDFLSYETIPRCVKHKLNNQQDISTGDLMFSREYIKAHMEDVDVMSADKDWITLPETQSQSGQEPCTGLKTDWWSSIQGTAYSRGLSWSFNSPTDYPPVKYFFQPDRDFWLISNPNPATVINYNNQFIGSHEYFSFICQFFFVTEDFGYVIVCFNYDHGPMTYQNMTHQSAGTFFYTWACKRMRPNTSGDQWEIVKIDQPPQIGETGQYQGVSNNYMSCGYGFAQPYLYQYCAPMIYYPPNRPDRSYIGLGWWFSLPMGSEQAGYRRPTSNFICGWNGVLQLHSLVEGEDDNGDPPVIESNPYTEPTGQEDTGTGERDNGSDTIGVSDETDGNGNVTIIGTLPPSEDSPLYSNGGLLTAYKLTQSEMSSLGQALWSSSTMQDIQNSLYKPIENIIACYFTNAPVANEITSAVTVKIAGHTFTGCTANKLTTNWVNLDCGNLNLKEYFGSCLDYSPYTTISIYLPFIGIVPLDGDYIVDSNINVRYNIDLLTGDCVAHVSSKKTHRMDYEGIIGSYNGNMYASIPMTSSNTWASRNLMGVGSLIGSLVSKSPVGAITNALNTVSTKPQYQKSGSLTSNTGLMGYKYPYLIIERPVDYIPRDYYKYQGLNSYVTKKLSDCSGLVICQNPILNIPNSASTPAPLEEEIEEIKMWLEKGVRL